MPPRSTVAPHPPTAATRLVDMAPPEQPLAPHDPRTVGEYQLTGRLGSGGMGTVYLGHRAGVTGSVAIKVLAPHLLDDVDARTRFLREGQTLQKVTGDYTARVHGVGFDGSMPYIVMERLDGPSLHALIAENGAVRDAETLTRIAIALARALAALHNDGITHRDLKPGNILLTSAGPKVVDFGIARVVGQTHHTPAGNMVGTPGYMAPEQVTGNGAGPATDVWAWACCVVFAARGDHLFDGENVVDIARRILDGPPSDAFARRRAPLPAPRAGAAPGHRPERRRPPPRRRRPAAPARPQRRDVDGGHVRAGTSSSGRADPGRRRASCAGLAAATVRARRTARTRGVCVASWDDLVLWVRVRYEVMAQDATSLTFRLPTTEGRDQLVYVRYRGEVEGHDWMQIESPDRPPRRHRPAAAAGARRGRGRRGCGRRRRHRRVPALRAAVRPDVRRVRGAVPPGHGDRGRPRAAAHGGRPLLSKLS